MKSPLIFLTKGETLALHEKLIERFGGVHGLRDEGALESALTAAENRFHYEGASLAVCAATYAYHLTQAHAFFDGNKRIGVVVAELFLDINDARLNAINEELTEFFLRIAASQASREEVEQWFIERVEEIT